MNNNIDEKSFSRRLGGMLYDIGIQVHQVVDSTISGELEARIYAITGPNKEHPEIIEILNDLLDEVIVYYRDRDCPYDFISFSALVRGDIREFFKLKGFKEDEDEYLRLSL